MFMKVCLVVLSRPLREGEKIRVVGLIPNALQKLKGARQGLPSVCIYRAGESDGPWRHRFQQEVMQFWEADTQRVNLHPLLIVFVLQSGKNGSDTLPETDPHALFLCKSPDDQSIMIIQESSLGPVLKVYGVGSVP